MRQLLQQEFSLGPVSRSTVNDPGCL